MRIMERLLSVTTLLCIAPILSASALPTPGDEQSLVLLSIDAGTDAPTLRTPHGAPALGGPFSLQVRDGQPGAHGLLFLSAASTPFVPQGSTSIFYPAPPFVSTAFRLNAEGDSRPLLYLPQVQPWMEGLQAFAQAGVSAPGGSPPDFTNALRLRAGVARGPLFDAVRLPLTWSPKDVEIADFDGDGDLDIAALSTDPITVVVWLTDDEGFFDLGGTYELGTGFNQRLTVGDVNGDTIPDIVVPRPGFDALGTLIGTGDGLFVPGADIPTGEDSEPQDVVVADIDGDEILDIVVTTLADGSLISTLTGVGDGTFDPPVEQCFNVDDGARLFIGRIDDDSIPDLIVVDNGVYFLKGLPGGLFSNASIEGFGVSDHLEDFAVADVNGDGNLDVIGAVDNDGISVLLGEGTGAFSESVVSSLPSVIAVSAAHLNNDTFADLVIIQSGFGAPDTFVTHLRSLGDGTFEPAGQVSSSSGSLDTFLGDLNGNGHTDLVVMNGGDTGLSVYYGSPHHPLFNLNDLPMGGWPVVGAIADFNADGIPDVTTGNEQSEDVSVRLGLGGGIFGEEIVIDTGIWTMSMTVGDFDGDGFEDIVISGLDFPTLQHRILYSNGDGTFDIENPFTESVEFPYGLDATDIDGNGTDDLVFALQTQTTPLTSLLGNEDRTLSAPIPSSILLEPIDVEALALHDLDGDEILDAIIPTWSDKSVFVFPGVGGGEFAFPTEYPLGGIGVRATAGDLNGDGLLDLIVARYLEEDSDTGSVSIFLASGPGVFGPPTHYEIPSINDSVAHIETVDVADFDGDGHLDVLSTERSKSRIHLYPGNGDGTLAPAILYDGGPGVIDTSVGDIDGDGIPDIVTTNAQGSITVLINRLGESR